MEDPELIESSRLDEQLKTEIADLQGRVNEGYLHRKKIDGVDFIPPTEVTLEERKKDKSFVYVTDSHLYPQLLSLALKKVRVPENQIMTFKQETLEHEYEHANAVIGDPDINEIWYGVIFFENSEGRIGVVPVTSFPGISETTHKKILETASDKSPSDHFLLRNKKRGLILRVINSLRR